jgi:hypothetical protein
VLLEIEKLKVQQKADKEYIEHLLEQVTNLKEIIALMKK